MLCNTDSDPEREKKHIRMLKGYLADGAILMASEMTCEELTELSREVPIVQCCEYRAGLTISHVSIDNEMAAYQAVNHFSQFGTQANSVIGAGIIFIFCFEEGWLPYAH